MLVNSEMRREKYQVEVLSHYTRYSNTVTSGCYAIAMALYLISYSSLSYWILSTLYTGGPAICSVCCNGVKLWHRGHRRSEVGSEPSAGSTSCTEERRTYRSGICWHGEEEGVRMSKGTWIGRLEYPTHWRTGQACHAAWEDRTCDRAGDPLGGARCTRDSGVAPSMNEAWSAQRERG